MVMDALSHHGANLRQSWCESGESFGGCWLKYL
jgi:hypothetical protein